MPKELNLSLLVRYGYGGGLLYLILVIFNRDSMKKYEESVGSVLALLIIFSAGTCLYAIYRHLIGEYFLFPPSHRCDWLINPRNRQGQRAVSTVWWLAQQGVPWGTRREAYTALRRDIPSESDPSSQAQTKRQLDLSHSEVYVLYITFLETLILGIVLWHSKGFRGGGWVVPAAFIFLLSAWAADIKLHRHEFRSLVPADPEKRELVLAFLIDRGYLPIASAKGQESSMTENKPGH